MRACNPIFFLLSFSFWENGNLVSAGASVQHCSFRYVPGIAAAHDKENCILFADMWQEKKEKKTMQLQQHSIYLPFDYRSSLWPDFVMNT